MKALHMVVDNLVRELSEKQALIAELEAAEREVLAVRAELESARQELGLVRRQLVDANAYINTLEART